MLYHLTRELMASKPAGGNDDAFRSRYVVPRYTPGSEQTIKVQCSSGVELLGWMLPGMLCLKLMEVNPALKGCACSSSGGEASVQMIWACWQSTWVRGHGVWFQ